MKIFITGASGFIGGQIAEALALGGHEVVAMARSERSAAKVRGRGATPVSCALGQVEPEALRGVDAVIHAAAKVEDWGPRADFWRTNVDGTRQLLEASSAASVGRFIHIGTEAALFNGAALVDVDEAEPYPQRQRFAYSESKAEAERLVLAASSASMVTLSLRPRLVWGPGDLSVLPEILRMAEGGSFAWLDGGRWRTSTTHVDNLVAAVERALVAGRGGEAYFVADAEVSTIRDFLSQLAGSQGVDLGSRSVPGVLARPLARLVERLWGVFHRPGKPPLTAFAAAMMSRTITVSTAKARAELGYAPVVSLAEGMAALRQQGAN